MSILFSSRALASLFVGLNLTRFALYEKTCLYEEGDVGMSNVYLTGGQLSGAQARAALGGLASWRSCLFVITFAFSSRLCTTHVFSQYYPMLYLLFTTACRW